MREGGERAPASRACTPSLAHAGCTDTAAPPVRGSRSRRRVLAARPTRRRVCSARPPLGPGSASLSSTGSRRSCSSSRRSSCGSAPRSRSPPSRSTPPSARCSSTTSSRRRATRCCCARALGPAWRRRQSSSSARSSCATARTCTTTAAARSSAPPRTLARRGAPPCRCRHGAVPTHAPPSRPHTGERRRAPHPTSSQVRAAPLDLALDLRALLAAGEVALRLSSLASPPPPPRAKPTPIASVATALHLPRHRRTTAGLRHLQHAAGGGGAPAPAPRKCYFQCLTLHPIALSYAASTSGFAELKTLVTALVAALQPAGAAPPAWAVALLSALGAAVASVAAPSSRFPPGPRGAFGEPPFQVSQ